MEITQLVDKAVTVQTATIASSGTTSGAVLLYGTTASIIEMPSAFTGTAITFEGSIDNGATFIQIRDENNNAITYTVSIASAGSYPLKKDVFAGYDQIKIVSNDTEASARTIRIKPFAI